ncbi:glyoxylase-like metal-dependent hydrolase (beta-lactamase superfamily II) [Deinococcus metalli]|uniref:Glyoxylase-like metal-dependent hydrolase (Beta-lactamase superfamily II) n=1 Tax=Deinococcus metalli TaxID=1141878 RepID=A0A7W8NS43_9DEIO|nr:MBL fold metallo-hydrolase [Deinococcus metalli]MBB5377583.1 glyoxylase-like metal-dependent hydrolase (beta-lactamase superfamily II) [Deinococcus metalli]
MAAPHHHGSVRVWSLSTGPLQENAVLIAGADGQGFLIDPGDDAERVLALVQEAGVTVRGVLLTHAHFDHIGAVQAVREALGVPVWLHPADLPLYRNGATSAARWNLPFVQPDDPEHEIAQDQVFTAGDLSVRARDLPGHAPGHVVFVGDGFVLAGDTLFQGSIGRTDLPGGNHPQLIDGLRRELLTLPDDTAVYPGHGAPTTVGAERRGNPYLR